MILTLGTETYLSSFQRDREAIAAAAEQGLRVAVPSCPGWSMATLLAHLGGTYAHVAKTVQAATGEDAVQELEDLALPPDIEAWFREEGSLETMPPTVVGWFEDVGAGLEEVLLHTDPVARAWTWWPPDQTAGFWLRRMAHETAVHRWDAESALGRAEPIDEELARDGIDEMLDIYMPRWCRPKSTRAGTGETYRLERTDGEAVWTIRFEGDGMEVMRHVAPADVVLRGTVSNLLLFLWQRVLADRLEVEGDRAVLGRYAELVPPD